MATDDEQWKCLAPYIKECVKAKLAERAPMEAQHLMQLMRQGGEALADGLNRAELAWGETAVAVLQHFDVDDLINGPLKWPWKGQRAMQDAR